jgi:RHS repeat-associated protein
MKITHTRSRLVQYNEYYPFGLPTAQSWTREGATENAYLGNGGSEWNSTLGMYDLEFREYDPFIGRMNAVDPMAPKYASLSTYHFSFNNPVSFTDVNGADPLYEDLYYFNRVMGSSGTLRNVRIMDTGTFGGGHITPGRGNWTDNLDRSPEAQRTRDYFLMTGHEFEAKYGFHQGDVELRNGQFYYFIEAEGRAPRYQRERLDLTEATVPGRYVVAGINGTAQQAQGGRGWLTMDQVAVAIRIGGIRRFIEFVQDHRYGPEFFLESIEQVQTANSEKQVIPSSVRFGMKAASWGHQYFANDELRHIIASFLITEKYDPSVAVAVTSSNEYLGFIQNDIPDLVRGVDNGWAFQVSDFAHNKQGMVLWVHYNWWRHGYIDKIFKDK